MIECFGECKCRLRWILLVRPVNNIYDILFLVFQVSGYDYVNIEIRFLVVIK